MACTIAVGLASLTQEVNNSKRIATILMQVDLFRAERVKRRGMITCSTLLVMPHSDAELLDGIHMGVLTLRCGFVHCLMAFIWVCSHFAADSFKTDAAPFAKLNGIANTSPDSLFSSSRAMTALGRTFASVALGTH